VSCARRRTTLARSPPGPTSSSSLPPGSSPSHGSTAGRSPNGTLFTARFSCSNFCFSHSLFYLPSLSLSFLLTFPLSLSLYIFSFLLFLFLFNMYFRDVYSPSSIFINFNIFLFKNSFMKYLKCSVSRWRPQKVDKRMVLEHTHGLFIT
jgi:hypothetical protein